MNRGVIMRLVGWANGNPLKCAGAYVRTVDVQRSMMDPDWLTVTFDVRQAMVWPDAADAFITYRTVLSADPVRPDGKPNRPMTALTVLIEQEP